MESQQINAYQKMQKTSLNPREVEAMAFTKAGFLLQDAIDHPTDKDRFRQALRFNNLLWTIIQADLMEEANTLAVELKANIMSLSIFVDRQTEDALRSGDVSKLPVLISINQNIAAGLRNDPGEGAPEMEKPDKDESSEGDDFFL